MSTSQTVLIIVCMGATAFLTGWLTLRLLFSPEKVVKVAGVRIQGIIPSVLNDFLQKEPGGIAGFLKSQVEFETLLADPAIYKTMRPTIEKHVDHFLQEKLSAAFPLLYKFMGEKTLGQFRATFLAEIDELFPEIMQQYGSTMLERIPITTIIQNQLSSGANSRLISSIRKNSAATRRLYLAFCMMAGFLAGTLLILLLSLIG